MDCGRSLTCGWGDILVAHTKTRPRGFLSYDFLRGQESDNWVNGSFDSVREQAARHSLAPEPSVPNALLYQYLLNQRFRKGEEDYQCARVFRSAADWLDDNAGGDSPFFLWVEAFDPQEPWESPAFLFPARTLLS